MDLPTYIDLDDPGLQRSYQQDLNQSLRQNLSDNGWIVPSVTLAQLTLDDIVNVSVGVTQKLYEAMPEGTLWFVADATPPGYFGKIGNDLVRFNTTIYVI